MQSSELPLNPINDERGHFLNLVNRHFEFAGAAIPRIDQINLTFVACDRLGKILSLIHISEPTRQLL